MHALTHALRLTCARTRQRAGNTANLPMVLVASLGSDPSLPFLYGSADLGLQAIILANLSATLISFPLVSAPATLSHSKYFEHCVVHSY